jgi:Dullard-like phosphatase family protein
LKDINQGYRLPTTLGRTQ